jgi:NAD(P)-dependent dehydrogenase (short-subunit alcohol dehydrogenase family)
MALSTLNIHCLLYFFEAYLGPKAATVDGYEKTFGVNYLGHFYLTYLLHDLLRRSAPARVINVSSNSYVKGKLDFDDLSLVNYEMFEAYTRSKMAIMHFTVEAHRMWFPEAIMSFSVHPGIHIIVSFRHNILF